MRSGLRRLRTEVNVIFVVPVVVLFIVLSIVPVVIPVVGHAAKYVEHPVKVPALSLSETPVGDALEAPLPTSSHPLSAHVRHLGTEDPAYAVVVSLAKKEVEVVLRTETGQLRTLTRFPIVSMARTVSLDALERAFYPVSFERQAVRAWDVSRPESGSRLRRTEVLFGEAPNAQKKRRRFSNAALTLAPADFSALLAMLVPLKTPILVLPKTDLGLTLSNPQRGPTRATLASPETASVETVLARVGTWRDAWERSSTEAYADAYVADSAQESFRSLGRSLQSWLSRMASLDVRERGTRKVSISQPHVLRVNGRTIAVFAQEYTSSARADFGLKVLTFDTNARAPRIVAEHWMPVNGSFSERLAKREPAKSPRVFRD